MQKIEDYIKSNDSLNPILEARNIKAVNLSKLLSHIFKNNEEYNNSGNILETRRTKRVLVMCNWCSSKDLCKKWEKKGSFEHDGAVCS